MVKRRVIEEQSHGGCCSAVPFDRGYTKPPVDWWAGTAAAVGVIVVGLNALTPSFAFLLNNDVQQTPGAEGVAEWDDMHINTELGGETEFVPTTAGQKEFMVKQSTLGALRGFRSDGSGASALGGDCYAVAAAFRVGPHRFNDGPSVVNSNAWIRQQADLSDSDEDLVEIARDMINEPAPPNRMSNARVQPPNPFFSGHVSPVGQVVPPTLMHGQRVTLPKLAMPSPGNRANSLNRSVGQASIPSNKSCRLPRIPTLLQSPISSWTLPHNSSGENSESPPPLPPKNNRTLGGNPKTFDYVNFPDDSHSHPQQQQNRASSPPPVILTTIPKFPSQCDNPPSPVRRTSNKGGASNDNPFLTAALGSSLRISVDTRKPPPLPPRQGTPGSLVASHSSRASSPLSPISPSISSASAESPRSFDSDESPGSTMAQPPINIKVRKTRNVRRGGLKSQCVVSGSPSLPLSVRWANS